MSHALTRRGRITSSSLVTTIRCLSVALVSAAALIGCNKDNPPGGGEANPAGGITVSCNEQGNLLSRLACQTEDSAAKSSAEGLWIGTTSNTREVFGIVLDDGGYWFIYSAANDESRVAGAFQGSGTSFNGNFTSTNARDFNLETRTISDATVSGSYRSRESLSGTVTYTRSNQSVAFATIYNSAYEQSPSLASAAGAYSGTATVANATETVAVNLSSDGTINGIGSSGCRFNGKATPRSRGSVYDVVVTFAGGVCSNGTNTVAGIGYFHSSTRRLYAAALNGARTNGFLFIGSKP